jgi:hypothetical protein
MNKLQIIIKDILLEMGNFAGNGGALGSSSGVSSQFSGPNVWNPNDNRLAQGIGGVTKRNFPELITKSNKRKRKVKRKKK